MDALAELTGALALVLKKARNLKQLDIELADDFLEADPALTAAILSLNNIEEINFGNVLDTTVGVIVGMRSPLKSAQLWLDWAFLDDGDTFADLVHLLANFREHLTELRVFHADISFDETTSAQYLHLRLLHLEATYSVDIKVLIYSFPNLEILIWENCVTIDDSDEAYKLREGNMKSPLRGWPKLDQLSCDVFRSYGLALTRPVRLWRDFDIGPSYLLLFVLFLLFILFIPRGL